ncbi:MAG: leucyl aminopeptidase family protein [Candidatus Choladocola sp.]|nr:leucyl aminopeptidase family protein [Candidatus Choladocola sp.]
MILKIAEESTAPVLICPEPEADMDRIAVKEAFSKAVKEGEKEDFSLNLEEWIERKGIDSLRDITEGILLADYQPARYPARPVSERTAALCGIREKQKAETIIRETENIVKGIVFARDMTNLPANMLRPLDFAGKVKKLMEGTGVDVEILPRERLQELGMNALLTVGESSSFPPCLAILRYHGDPDSEKVTALVGKGVTVDTGGYCLKRGGDSMMGIRGDMAGGAAVAGAVFALAVNQVKVNVTGLIPMCENRLSSGSMVPGDVITAYGGKTIQIVNTDAEGRLILADAVSYAVLAEKADRVMDIATLTGAAVAITGFGAAPCMADDESFFQEFVSAAEISGERYLRLPIYSEYEKQIVSDVADLKNSGGRFAATITAGLFIRSFAGKAPWMHLDIAGTAWVDAPVYEFQSKGATGAGVTTMYYLCSGKGE